MLTFFFIDNQQNILEKAKKPHVYRGYTPKPKTKSWKKRGDKPRPPSSGRKPLQKAYFDLYNENGMS